MRPHEAKPLLAHLGDHAALATDLAVALDAHAAGEVNLLRPVVLRGAVRCGVDGRMRAVVGWVRGLD